MSTMTAQDAAGAPPVDLVDFASMEHRIRYMSETFGHHLSGKLLDVGCAQRYLEKLRPDLDYTGVDMGGQPDIRLNFEEIERLPFDDGNFDAVVCCDVLEHLNNLHFMFSELVRVSKKTVLISLPNCWTAARKRIDRGKGEIGLYGLTANAPEDRHKWFFSLTEARKFVEDIAPKHNLTLKQMRVTEKPRPALVRTIRRLRHPVREHYLNRYAHTLWAVFEKA